MSKRTVLKVIAGVGVVGVVAAIVHRSNRKVRYADLAVREAAQLVEEAAKTVDEAIDLIEDYRDEAFDCDFLEEDFENDSEDEEFENADSPCGCPYEDRCCIYAERLEKNYEKEGARA